MRVVVVFCDDDPRSSVATSHSACEGLDVITCYIRYVLDLQEMDAFAEYGRLWTRAITKLGGTHHGYFVPSQDPEAANHRPFSFPNMGSEGPTNVGVAIFSFPDWEACEPYRRQGGRSEEVGGQR